MIARRTVRWKLRIMAALFTGSLLLIGAGGIGILLRVSQTQETASNTQTSALKAERQITTCLFAFKEQMQAWKNILLRGSDPKDYEKYVAKFKKLGQETDAQLEAIKPELVALGLETTSIASILKVHETLNETFLGALKSWNPAKPETLKSLDASVRSKDEGVEKGILDLQERIEKRVTHLQANQTSEFSQTLRRSLLAISGIVTLSLALLLTLMLSITRGILMGLGGISSAMEKASHLDLREPPEAGTQDEFGQISKAFNNLLAAFRTSLQTLEGASQRAAKDSSRLSQAAGSIAQTTASVAQHTTLQQTATEAMAAAMAELSASIEAVANNVQNAEARTRKAVAAATEGSAQGTRTQAAMEAMAQTMAQMVGAVRVIQDIARQTNLLSLNAAIEAAKAGAQGKGFAVVAEEVRKLAERSGQAAREIGQLIERTHQTMAEDRETVTATVSILASIQTHIGEVSDMIGHIGNASAEQAQTAREVARQVDHIALETSEQANASSTWSDTAKSISHAASDLAEVSEAMAVSVRKFQL